MDLEFELKLILARRVRRLIAILLVIGATLAVVNWCLGNHKAALIEIVGMVPMAILFAVADHNRRVAQARCAAARHRWLEHQKRLEQNDRD